MLTAGGVWQHQVLSRQRGWAGTRQVCIQDWRQMSTSSRFWQTWYLSSCLATQNVFCHVLYQTSKPFLSIPRPLFSPSPQMSHTCTLCRGWARHELASGPFHPHLHSFCCIRTLITSVRLLFGGHHSHWGGGLWHAEGQKQNSLLPKEKWLHVFQRHRLSEIAANGLVGECHHVYICVYALTCPMWHTWHCCSPSAMGSLHWAAPGWVSTHQHLCTEAVGTCRASSLGSYAGCAYLPEFPFISWSCIRRMTWQNSF